MNYDDFGVQMSMASDAWMLRPYDVLEASVMRIETIPVCPSLSCVLLCLAFRTDLWQPNTHVGTVTRRELRSKA